MNIADPKYLEQLRDLPSSYLLDLLADNEDIDKESVFWVLQERGLAREPSTCTAMHWLRWPNFRSLR